LAPAFDLNPDPRPGPKLLSTAIDFDDYAASIETLLGIADGFALDAVAARQVLRDVSAATERWRLVAREVGCNPVEMDDMALAFEHERLAQAHEIVT
jgi:serine/threonine-protein kinase HipA